MRMWEKKGKRKKKLCDNNLEIVHERQMNWQTSALDSVFVFLNKRIRTMNEQEKRNENENENRIDKMLNIIS